MYVLTFNDMFFKERSVDPYTLCYLPEKEAFVVQGRDLELQSRLKETAVLPWQSSFFFFFFVAQNSSCFLGLNNMTELSLQLHKESSHGTRAVARQTARAIMCNYYLHCICPSLWLMGSLDVFWVLGYKIHGSHLKKTQGGRAGRRPKKSPFSDFSGWTQFNPTSRGYL